MFQVKGRDQTNGVGWYEAAAAQMDVDSSATAAAAAAGEPAAQSKRASKGRVQKRKKVGSSKVVFRLYKDKKANKRR